MAKLADYGTNVAGLQRSLRELPKTATVELRDASLDIATTVASLARARAALVGGVYRHVGPTIQARRDRIPVVAIGGSAKLPARSDGVARRGGRQTVGDVLWGAEFGGRARPSTMQFLPHLGTTGYALWPTVRDQSDETRERYVDALDQAMSAAGMGAP